MTECEGEPTIPVNEVLEQTESADIEGAKANLEPGDISILHNLLFSSIKSSIKQMEK